MKSSEHIENPASRLSTTSTNEEGESEPESFENFHRQSTGNNNDIFESESERNSVAKETKNKIKPSTETIESNSKSARSSIRLHTKKQRTEEKTKSSSSKRINSSSSSNSNGSKFTENDDEKVRPSRQDVRMNEFGNLARSLQESHREDIRSRDQTSSAFISVLERIASKSVNADTSNTSAELKSIRSEVNSLKSGQDKILEMLTRALRRED